MHDVPKTAMFCLWAHDGTIHIRRLVKILFFHDAHSSICVLSSLNGLVDHATDVSPHRKPWDLNGIDSEGNDSKSSVKYYLICSMLTLVPVNNSPTPTRSVLQPSRRGLINSSWQCVREAARQLLPRALHSSNPGLPPSRGGLLGCV